MKVLITGSHGFIGQYLVKALEKRGDMVVRFPRVLLKHQAALGAVFTGDTFDYIFHLAAYGNMAHQSKDFYQMLEANYLSTYSILMATKDMPYKALINVSSSSVLLPHQTMYSATKMGAEYLCKSFVDEFDKSIVSVRPTSVYGPGESDFRFIPTVFRSCLKGAVMPLVPEAGHDWIYIDDVVDRMIEVAEKADELKGKSINLGTNISIQNKVVVELIEEITGKKANTVEAKRLRTFDDKAWIIESPWESYLTLQVGLRRCYQYYKERYV